jgi:hypothetical protein
MKETFILRTEWYSSLETLSVKAKSELLDALFLTHCDRDNEIKITDSSAKLCWNFMKPTIDYHTRKYNTSVENGKKGGRPTTQEKPKENPKKPNLNPKVIQEETLKVKPNNNLTGTGCVIDSVSVIDSVCVSGSVCDTEFVSGKNDYDYTDREAQKLADDYLKKYNV